MKRDVVAYRGCQKNVPIEDLFSATTPYAAILFSEHYYDKRYKKTKGKPTSGWFPFLFSDWLTNTYESSKRFSPVSFCISLISWVTSRTPR